MKSFPVLNLESIQNKKVELKSRLAKLSKADDGALPIPPAVLDEDNTLPAVTYSIFQMNDAPAYLKDSVDTGQQVLEKFLSMAGSIVQMGTDEHGDEWVQSAEAWKDAFSFFTDFFQISQIGSRKLKQTTKGTDVARTTLNFACNVIAADIGDFKSYLQGVADVLSTEAKKTEQSQTMLYNFCQHNLFENSSGVVTYLPQISYANTKFSLQESKNLGMCSDTHEINLDLSVYQQVLTFNIKSYMDDPTFRKQCDDFLDIFRASSIAQKENTLLERFKKVKPAE